MSEKDERLGVSLAFEPGYLRPTPIHEANAAMSYLCPTAIGKDLREYVGFVVDKAIDALCREAAKEAREELIDFVLESVNRTNPSVRASLEARREQNHHDALTLTMPKLLLKEHLRARFEYFDTKWGSIQYIYKGRPDLDPIGVRKG